MSGPRAPCNVLGHRAVRIFVFHVLIFTRPIGFEIVWRQPARTAPETRAVPRLGQSDSSLQWLPSRWTADRTPHRVPVCDPSAPLRQEGTMSSFFFLTAQRPPISPLLPARLPGLP